jgi:RNA polymerase sigma-70 factor, ECF subfamily
LQLFDRNDAMTFESERYLVQAAQSGNMLAFERLYLETREFVLRSARYLSGEQDAEDIAQETYIRALKSISGFRGECRFTTWLYRIVYNQAISSQRKAHDCCALELLPPALAQSARDIDASIDIDRSLASIRYRERQLIFRSVEGHSDSEIAEELGLSIAAIKSRRYRLRKTLRAALAPS